MERVSSMKLFKPFMVLAAIIVAILAIVYLPNILQTAFWILCAVTLFSFFKNIFFFLLGLATIIGSAYLLINILI
jgi:hypothetical protein